MKKIRGPLYLILILLLLVSCAARQAGMRQGPARRPIIGQAAMSAPALSLKEALEEMRFGREAEALPELLIVRDKYQGTAFAARASFILGLYELKRHGPRAVLYLQEAQALGEIRPYVLLYLARAYAEEGDLPGASRAYDSIRREYPDFLYAGDVLFELAGVLEMMGRPGEALSMFRAFVSKYPGHARFAEALLRTARLEMASGGYARAAMDLKTLIVRYPGTRVAKKAEGTFRDNRRLSLPSLGAEELCARAEALFKSYHYRSAATELSDLLRSGPAACGSRAGPLLIETLFRLKRYEEAAIVLRRRLEKISGNDGKKAGTGYEQRSGLVLLATAYLRGAKGVKGARGSAKDGYDDFIHTVDTLVRKFPRSREARRALLMEGGYYEEAGQWDEAIGAYGQAEKAGGDRPSPEAAWRRGWLQYRMGRYIEAAESMDLGGLNAGGRRGARLAYWRGRALEKAGRGQEARGEYALACKGWMPGYYCYMAVRRLGLDGSKGLSGRMAWNPDREVSGAQDGSLASGVMAGDFGRTHMLLSVGLSGEAAKEVQLALKRRRPRREEVLSLIEAFYSAGDYYHAMSLFENYAGLLRDIDGTMPPALLEVAFPLKMVEYIKTRGLAGDADPLLVAAVMREESSFDPDTISRTGAVGLMQVMPETAEFIARASARGRPRPYDLGDPDTNIRMGAWYLAYLWQRTGGDPVDTIAGYNAGLNVVRRWRKNYPLDDDEFIESIPYTETRNYTKKVLKSYRAFKSLASLGGQMLIADNEKGREEDRGRAIFLARSR